MKSAACLRARAKEILSRDGNRLLLIEAQAILLLVLSAFLLLNYTASLVLFTWGEAGIPTAVIEIVCGALCQLLTWVLALPLGFGLFYMAKRIVEGHPATLADLFYAFRSRETYMRALWGTYDVLIVVSGCLILFSLIDACAPSLLSVPWGSAAVFLLFFLLFLLFTAPSYTRIYDALCDVELERPSPLARARRAWRLWGGYLPLLLLGLLTVGLTLIADVIPRLLISQAIDCADACTPIYDDIPEDEYCEFSCDK